MKSQKDMELGWTDGRMEERREKTGWHVDRGEKERKSLEFPKICL